MIPVPSVPRRCLISDISVRICGSDGISPHFDSVSAVCGTDADVV